MDEHYSPIRRECHGECIALDAICGYLFTLHCNVLSCLVCLCNFRTFMTLSPWTPSPGSSSFFIVLSTYSQQRVFATYIFKDPFAASEHSWYSLPTVTSSSRAQKKPWNCQFWTKNSISCGITQCLEDTSLMFHNALDSSGSCAVGQCLEDGECRACKSTR